MLPIVIFERILDFLELKEKFYLAVVAELDHWLMRKNNVALGIASFIANQNLKNLIESDWTIRYPISYC